LVLEKVFATKKKAPRLSGFARKKDLGHFSRKNEMLSFLFRISDEKKKTNTRGESE
jgi:hypothetical protein